MTGSYIESARIRLFSADEKANDKGFRSACVYISAKAKRKLVPGGLLTTVYIPADIEPEDGLEYDAELEISARDWELSVSFLSVQEVA